MLAPIFSRRLQSAHNRRLDESSAATEAVPVEPAIFAIHFRFDRINSGNRTTNSGQVHPAFCCRPLADSCQVCLCPLAVQPSFELSKKKPPCNSQSPETKGLGTLLLPVPARSQFVYSAPITLSSMLVSITSAYIALRRVEPSPGSTLGSPTSLLLPTSSSLPSPSPS